jgi:hypothetical protein
LAEANVRISCKCNGLVALGHLLDLIEKALDMWFAKWFGGRRRKDEHAEDEPARFPPSPAVAQAPAQGARPAQQAAQQPAKSGKAPEQVVNTKNGFDPYNSGAFVKRNAWERTNLR